MPSASLSFRANVFFRETSASDGCWHVGRHDFWLYKEIDQPPTNVTCRGFSRRIQVAGGDSSHYDLVISKQEATDRAMAQCQ